MFQIVYTDRDPAKTIFPAFTRSKSDHAFSSCTCFPIGNEGFAWFFFRVPSGPNILIRFPRNSKHLSSRVRTNFSLWAVVWGFKFGLKRGAWVAQSVKHLTSAQVMISWFVGSSPASGSVLTARSLEPASDSVSPSLSAPPLLMLCLSVSKINKNIKKIKKGGAWVAQSVKSPTSAQVMILRSMSSGPASGSVLTARSLEPASNPVSPSLFASL